MDSNGKTFLMQEIEKLQQIYEEELAKGSKRLWVRITERVNKTVRIAKRQAIEYKYPSHYLDGRIFAEHHQTMLNYAKIND
jgi:head-tail adaptor